MEDKRTVLTDYNGYYEVSDPFLMYKCASEPKTLVSRRKPF